MENSVNRNKVAHTHEVVYSLVYWLDDEVFEQCPTWEDCLAAGIFTSPQLESFFGPEGNQYGKAEGAGGPGNYKQYVERGAGRNVIAKMLDGTENEGTIKQAIANLPMTDRSRRYEEEQAELARPFPPFPPVPMGGASAAEIVQILYIWS